MALVRWLVPTTIIALIAISIAWAFAMTVLQYGPRMGLPLDDSYIYLTYAKQFGRGEPFSYFPGGGYSAGSTSVLWPMVLAPLWTLGARGHALVWASYVTCTLCYALTAIGVWRIVRKLASDWAGVAAALAVLVIAPFAWTALSGMEVAFASALLVATIALLIEQSPTGPPAKRLALCLAAASLSRPEATVIVGGIVAIAVLARLRRREWRAAAWWLVPLAPPIAWLVANKLLAGQLFPNTGVAKSYFYLPGFDWSYWFEAVPGIAGKMLRGVFWDDTSPLVWPKLVVLVWHVGAARIVLWARRTRRYLAAAVLLGAPFVLVFAVVASSGLWSFQNYRYIAPAFPLLLIPIGVALAPLGLERWSRWRAWMAPVLAGVIVLVGLVQLGYGPQPATGVVMAVFGLLPFALLLPTRLLPAGAIAFVLGLFGAAAVPPLRADAKLFAQGALDVNTQVVAIGERINTQLPDAHVMFHDAGAIAYFGDGRVYDMLGLVTNYQAGIANHGPGARFEFIESLPPERRPTHFAYYPSWLGNTEFFGEVLMQTPLKPRIPGLAKSPLVGDTDMQIIVATYDHAGTGERPLAPAAGWRVVDRVDVAHLASERAHGWRGAIGRRNTGDPTARWTVVGREAGARGLVVDGGRTIRGILGRDIGETFTLAVDASKPVRLVLRTGGAANYPFHEAITRPVELKIFAGDREVGRAVLPPPTGPFVEVVFELPAPGGELELRTEAPTPYRAFHWFALQR